jgi:hypothetical protein
MKPRSIAPRYGMGRHQGRPGLWAGAAQRMLIPCKRGKPKAAPVFRAKVILLKHG